MNAKYICNAYFVINLTESEILGLKKKGNNENQF